MQWDNLGTDGCILRDKEQNGFSPWRFFVEVPLSCFQSIFHRERDWLIDWLIDSLLFEYGNFISYITSLHESRIETEVNTVQLH